MVNYSSIFKVITMKVMYYNIIVASVLYTLNLFPNKK